LQERTWREAEPYGGRRAEDEGVACLVVPIRGEPKIIPALVMSWREKSCVEYQPAISAFNEGARLRGETENRSDAVARSGNQAHWQSSMA
jgi:hypothetical protein